MESTAETKTDEEVEVIKRKSKKIKKAKSHSKNVEKSGTGPQYDKVVNLKKASYKPSDFKIIKEVGEGSYGRVYLAERVSDGRKCAIKMLDKHHLIKSHKVEHVMREKKILTEF